jgi:predicted  nucleic acid-binding Zn-ribbon protein
MLKMETLEKRVADLESENQTLTTRVAVLESEKSGLESKDQSLEERIRALEDQLAEAHRALTQSINKKN